jgi:DNA mismatch endonuclease, patch repair protein
MDDRSPEARSKTMAAVKSRNTKLELGFFKELQSRGLTGIEEHPPDIIGKPDLIHRAAKVAVFIDGCFWHGCRLHLRMPSANNDYWVRKISRNRRRDSRLNKELREDGWLVLRIWEHSLKRPRLTRWWLTHLSNAIKTRTHQQTIFPAHS